MSQLSFEQEFKAEGVVLLRPKGHIDSHTSREFQETLEELFAQGNYKIDIDLSQVEYISSSGYSIIMIADEEVQEHQGRIVLTNGNETIQAVMQMLGLSKLYRGAKAKKS